MKIESLKVYYLCKKKKSNFLFSKKILNDGICRYQTKIEMKIYSKELDNDTEYYILDKIDKMEKSIYRYKYRFEQDVLER